jgi:nucleoside permease NupC
MVCQRKKEQFSTLINKLTSSLFQINWRVLIVGCLMQYILGVFVLRTEFGIRLFDFLGNQVTVFLDFTDSGCK